MAKLWGQKLGLGVYTLQPGDTVRDSSTATVCEATHEAGIPNLFCTHAWRGRDEIVFWKDRVDVFDLDDPNAEPLVPRYSLTFGDRAK